MGWAIVTMVGCEADRSVVPPQASPATQAGVAAPVSSSPSHPSEAAPETPAETDGNIDWGAAPSFPSPQHTPAPSPTGSGTPTIPMGACGRVQALEAYRDRLLSVIAEIKAHGGTKTRHTDLMQAVGRLHHAEADLAMARADVAIARHRLRALTGGTLDIAAPSSCP